MKDLIVIIAYLYVLASVVFFKFVSMEYLLFVFSLIFVLKFIQMKKNIKEIKNNEIPKLLKKQKEDFIDTLNHDLKVPTIAQLRGIELMQNEIFGKVNKEQSALLFQLSDSCKYVLEMISMLKNSYVIDNNAYNLVYEKFNISDSIVSCFEKLAQISGQKNLKIIYTPSNADTILEADKTEIGKVIFNMLYSAINYSKNGGRISVKTYTDDNRIIFSVSGMELEINQNYSTIGHGIGMYLSKKIIELHNGKIFIPQGGNLSNTFTFVLPKYKKVPLKQ